MANQRRDLAHKVSRQLVNDYDLIACENLRISSMVRRPKPRKDADTDGYLPNGAGAKAGLNRSIHDAGWGMIVSMLDYKAEEAGRQLVQVDPATVHSAVPSAGTARRTTGAPRPAFTVVPAGTVPTRT
ncbi:MAG: hypothetical protein ACLP62_05985 [Acidimicrobiales bacterium]